MDQEKISAFFSLMNLFCHDFFEDRETAKKHAVTAAGFFRTSSLGAEFLHYVVAAIDARPDESIDANDGSELATLDLPDGGSVDSEGQEHPDRQF